MVASMKPGSVTVDLAAETGGNIATTVPDQVITTPNVSSLLRHRFACRNRLCWLVCVRGQRFSAFLCCAIQSLLFDQRFCHMETVSLNTLPILQGVICIGYTALPSRLPTQSSTL